MVLASQFLTHFDLNGMYKAFKCSPFFQFISQEINQATISLVSLLESQKRRLKSQRFSRIESPVSRHEGLSTYF